MKQFPPNPKPETLAKRVLAAAEDLEPDDMIAVPPVAERYASAEPRRAYETYVRVCSRNANQSRDFATPFIIGKVDVAIHEYASGDHDAAARSIAQCRYAAEASGWGGWDWEAIVERLLETMLVGDLIKLWSRGNAWAAQGLSDGNLGIAIGVLDDRAPLPEQWRWRECGAS